MKVIDWFEKHAGGSWNGEYSVECPICGKRISGIPVSYGGDTLEVDAYVASIQDACHPHREGLELLCKKGIARRNQIKDSIQDQMNTLYNYYSKYDFILKENHDEKKRFSGYIFLFAKSSKFPEDSNVMQRLLGIAKITFRVDHTESYRYPLLCNREKFDGVRFGDSSIGNMKYFALQDVKITRIYLLDGRVLTTKKEFTQYKRTVPYEKVCCNRITTQQKRNIESCWIVSFATFPKLDDIETMWEELDDIYVNINITGRLFYDKPYTLFTSLADAIDFIKLWDSSYEKIINKSHKLLIEK